MYPAYVRESAVGLISAYKIRVIGIVQGVGFRPYVYRLAKSMGLKGYVKNMGGSEVEIHLEGPEARIHEFSERLVREKPPQALIEEVKMIKTKPVGYKDFSILPSSSKLESRSMIPPDIGICKDCLREILDPSTRWYMYPFNSCVNCGPRFSMMYTTPYDRENTSMRDFPLCQQCMSEYNDPGNTRRFHAQGISCPVCGPRVTLYDKYFNKIETSDPIREAARLIDRGYIVAIKGLGGYHIASLASEDDIVMRLRKFKKRPSQPFALMALDYSVVEKICDPPPGAREVLESPERPILLLPKKPGSRVSELVAPGLGFLGVMLPYTGLHYLLLSETRDKFLIMTSGNKHGRPMCIDEDCAKRELSEIVDYFLNHNRVIVNRVDDSVARFTRGRLMLLRRGRGYAPKWIRTKMELEELVAFGADLQTAGAVSFEDKIVLTQYIGDIDDYMVMDDYDKYMRFFVNTYRVKPRAVVVDAHPGYSSRRLGELWAEKLGVDIIEVYHHHAHAVQAMIEADIEPGENIASITIDGAGYGVDGRIWGGEILLASHSDFKRIAHLEYQPMPGGDQTTRYPARMLIGILSKIMEEDELLYFLKKRGVLEGLKYGETEARISYRLAKKSSPLTSSTGRVLDALSALLRICYERTYEGEPAIKLEAAASRGRIIEELLGDYTTIRGDSLVISTTDLFKRVLDVIDDYDIHSIARTFLFVLGENMARIAVRYSEKPMIIVSGGAAVNEYIMSGIEAVARDNDYEVIVPLQTPPGDGGIAVGQVIIASQKLSG